MAATDAIWVDVLPNMSKFGPAVGAGAAGAAAPAGAAGMATGRAFGLAMIAGVAAVAAAGVLAGKALYDVGKTFDEMTDNIRVGTGATGDDLDALVDSAKNIGTKVPASFEKIGATVADLNTTLGYSGKPLEALSEQVLQLSRITGEDVNIRDLSATLSGFKIPAEEATSVMDELYQISQATGTPVNELTANLKTQGGILQEVGLGLADSAALFGALEKSGVNANTVIKSMGPALVRLAKDGEDPAEAFSRVTGELQGFVDSGNDAEALNLAGQVFGTRGATQFVAALKSGKVNLDDMTGAIGATDDTIMEAAAETASFGETWIKFKNTIMVAVEPVATRLFDTISNGMAWIMDKAVPAVQAFAGTWNNSTGPLSKVREVLGNVQTFIVDRVIPAATAIGAVIVDTVVPLAQQWYAIFQEKVLPVLKMVADFIVTNVMPTIVKLGAVVMPIIKLIGAVIKTAFQYVILPALGLVWDFIGKVLAPVFMWLWRNIVDPVITWVSDKIATFATSATTFLDKPVKFIREKLGPIFTWLRDNIISPMLSSATTLISNFSTAAKDAFDVVRSFIVDRVGPAFKTFGDGVRDVFDGLRAAVAKPINFVINTVWNNGLAKVLRLIPGLGDKFPNVATIKGYDGGGWTGPGSRYQPAGIVHADEYVLTKPEVRRMGGPSAVEEWKRAYPGYARGGRVKPVRSNTSGNTYRGHTGLDFPAGRGTPVRATAAGTITRVQSLRGSYGNHVIQSIAGTVWRALYAHLSSFAVRSGQSVAMGQTIGGVGNTGNSRGNHLHFEAGPALGRTSTVGTTRSWLSGASAASGAAGAVGGAVGAPDAVSSIWETLKGIPGKISGIINSVKEGLTGPWGELMRGGIVDMISGVKDWVLDKINPFSNNTVGTKEAGVLSKTKRGYAGGTSFAQPGLAQLAEHGAELVMSPQVRNMQGGESIASASRTRALFGGQNGRLRPFEGTLKIDEDGNAYIRGMAEEVYDDREDSAERWNREYV